MEREYSNPCPIMIGSKSLSQINIWVSNGDLEHVRMDMESDDVRAPQHMPIERFISTILSISQENFLVLQMLSKKVSFLKKHVIGKGIPNANDNVDNE